jgi:hypothetical protein
LATKRPGVKLTDISWPADELPSRSKMTSTVNTVPDWTSEGAFAIEYEGTPGAVVGVAVGVAVGVPVGVGVEGGTPVPKSETVTSGSSGSSLRIARVPVTSPTPEGE